MDKRPETPGGLAARTLRSLSHRMHLFVDPAEYEEAIAFAEGLLAQARQVQREVERQRQEIEQLRELLNRQAPGVVVTGKDSTLHQFDQATGWEREKDGALRVIRKLEDPQLPLQDIAAFAPGTWRDVRHTE